MKKLSLKTALCAVATALVVLALVIALKPMYQSFASVAVSNGYIATSTSAISGVPAYWNLTATSSTDSTAHTGILGGCTVTAAGSAGGSIDFIDATTSNVKARTGQPATSTILIASIPSNLAAGTYTFDAIFKTGLFGVVTGTHGTTTCMYRLGG